MALSVEDLNDQSKYKLLSVIPYNELVTFVFDYLKRRSLLMIFFWIICLIFLAVAIMIRIDSAGHFLLKNIILHSVLGFIIFPLICIPFHEGLHIIPFFLTGARNIRVGMDLRQYIFYVTAHRYVASPLQFIIVALLPFLVISTAMLILIITLPGLWKWSLSVFLFAHATMCAGDIALLNLYYLNKDKKIYTWDDADEKVAYFYEEIKSL